MAGPSQPFHIRLTGLLVTAKILKGLLKTGISVIHFQLEFRNCVLRKNQNHRIQWKPFNRDFQR